MRKRIVIFLSFLVILLMACGLATNTGTGTTPQTKPVNTFANPTASPTIDPNPVSINDALGSLNSYQLTVMFKSTGPDPTQSSTITEVTQRSRDPDAAYTQFNMSTVKKGGGDPSNTDTSIYTIGNDQCSGSKDSWTWTSNTPAQKEMEDLIKNMIGMTPMIDNPAFVAQETVNDIPSNHFSFQVSGLGAKSGAVVDINKGDYWLAVDGQYIVRYTLILETSTAANSEVLHEEVSIDLNHINQPVDISFPQGCPDASKVTPTP